MQSNNAFARAKAMMAAIAVAMQFTSEAQRQAQLATIGPYESRGHGSGKWPKSRHRVAMDKRASVKARNVKRHKAHL